MIFYKSPDDDQTLVKVVPEKGDLKQINALAVEPVTAEEIYTGSMALCNNQYDRAWERFPESYLKRFADTIVGKSVLSGHDYRSLPVGRFYDAEVHETKRGRLDLITKYYMMAEDDLVPKIKAGVIKGVSVGFRPDKRLCDLDGKDYDGWYTNPDDEEPCVHIAGRMYDGKRATITYGGDEANVSADEGSFVWLGCQYGAQTVARGIDLGPEGKSAFLLQREANGTRQWSGFTPGVRTHKEQAMSENEKGAPPPEGKAACTQAEYERLKAEAVAGEKYRERMLTRIKTRYAACDLEDTGKALAEGLKAAPIEAVEKAEADAEKLFEARHKPHGTGVPDSAGDQKAAEEGKELEFNPLRYRPQEYF